MFCPKQENDLFLRVAVTLSNIIDINDSYENENEFSVAYMIPDLQMLVDADLRYSQYQVDHFCWNPST